MHRPVRQGLEAILPCTYCHMQLSWLDGEGHVRGGCCHSMGAQGAVNMLALNQCVC
jgi:hypothetical protein